MSIADKLTQIAENEQAVFDAGKESERDRFWDAFQDNGNRVLYNYAFRFQGWTAANFRPKYSMRPTAANGMFRDSHISADLGAILSECGVTLDFSDCAGMEQVFYNTYFTALPEIDLSGAIATSAFDYSGRLVTISNVIVSETTHFGAYKCVSLKNITITGTIANSLGIAESPLTKASIESIIGALSGTVAGKTLTVNAAAKQAAFTDAEWAALIGTKPNWTISLV